MTSSAPEDPGSADWEVVAEFLRTTADALLEVSEVAAIAPEVGAVDIGSMAPAVLRYERFAELLHSEGVARLMRAATAVARSCEVHLQIAPSAQEIEWIISVAAQEPIEELAMRNETSTRGMYRRIEKMWERLGVANQVQGVAYAVQQGWIAPPPFDSGKS